MELNNNESPNEQVGMKKKPSSPSEIVKIADKNSNETEREIKELNGNSKKSWGLKNLMTLSWCLLGLIILLLIFKAGMVVGFKKANFSIQWGQHYSQNFAGPRDSFLLRTFGPDEYIEANGAFGQILQVNKDSLIMIGASNVEKIILLKDDSIIRAQKRELKLNELRVGDNIVVIGEPNENGQIEAKLIRIMPTPPPNQMPMMNFFQKRLF